MLLQGRYFEAVCTHIDPVSKEITACFPAAHEDCFQLPYDMLIIGVRAQQTRQQSGFLHFFGPL